MYFNLPLKEKKNNEEQKLHKGNLCVTVSEAEVQDGVVFEYIWINEILVTFLSIVCRKYVKNHSGKDCIVLI